MLTKRQKEICVNIYKDELNIIEEEERGWDFQQIVWEVQNTIEGDIGYLAEEGISMDDIREYLFSIKDELPQPSGKICQEWKETNEILNS